MRRHQLRIGLFTALFAVASAAACDTDPVRPDGFGPRLRGTWSGQNDEFRLRLNLTEGSFFSTIGGFALVGAGYYVDLATGDSTFVQADGTRFPNAVILQLLTPENNNAIFRGEIHADGRLEGDLRGARPPGSPDGGAFDIDSIGFTLNQASTP